jgi:hypothetical protein
VESASIPAQAIGTVLQQEHLQVQHDGVLWLDQPLTVLRDCFEQAIPRRMGGQA